MTRVAITGTGVVSPLGRSRAAVLDALLEGRSAIRVVETLRGERTEATLAAEVGDFDAAREAGRTKNLKYMSRASALAVAAARLALEESGLAVGDGEDVSCHVGIGMTSSEVADLEKLVTICEDERGKVSLTRLGEHGLRATNPLISFKILSNMPLCHVALATRARGTNVGLHSLGAETLTALARAMDELVEGRARAAIWGGVDAQVDRAGVAQLARQGLLAPSGTSGDRAARAFDAASRGRVLGEGAAFATLELEATARARGARILGFVERPFAAAAGTVGLEPMGAAPLEAALERALAGADVSCVLASAAGDPRGDGAEARALARVVGKRVPVGATRGSLGDALAAGPALDVVVALAALERGLAPPVRGEPTHAALDLVRAPRPLAGKQVAVLAGGVASVASACVVSTEGA